MAEMKMAEMTLKDENKGENRESDAAYDALEGAKRLGRLPGTAPLQVHIRDLVDFVVEENIPTDDMRPLLDELCDFLFEHLREHLPITNAQQLLELLAKMPR